MVYVGKGRHSMLYMVLKSGAGFRWNVGDSCVLETTAKFVEVEEIQADGDELDLILQMCQNLPLHKGRVISWYGDHAKFIARALNLISYA